MKRLILFLAWQRALIVSLILFVASTSYAIEDQPTARLCLDAYLRSEAASVCDGGKGGDTPPSVNVFVNFEGKCALADDCPKEDGTSSRSKITVELDYADELVNCNGVLKLEGCG